MRTHGSFVLSAAVKFKTASYCFGYQLARLVCSPCALVIPCSCARDFCYCDGVMRVLPSLLIPQVLLLIKVQVQVQAILIAYFMLQSSFFH